MSTATSSINPVLLRELAAGSESAFTTVFEQYRTKIYSVAMQYLKSAPLAEEVLQEVFLKLWLKRDLLTDVADFESWFFTVARNFILNYLRKIAHEKAGQQSYAPEVSAPQDTDYKVLHAQYNELLQSAVETLSEQQRSVYRLAREEGLTYEAIANRLSISPFTVKAHMARALQALRQFLAEHGDLFIILFILKNHAL